MPPRVVPDAAAEAAAASDVEVLIAKLDENLGRVIDLFRALDVDSSGSVSKREFRKGIGDALGAEISLEECAALFALLDPDDSGTLEYRELDAKLHRRNVRHAA